MLDAERQQRQAQSAKFVKKKQIRCNAPWARQFVPGAAESGVELPEGVQECTLNCPPDVHAWVARYRHPNLQKAGARPTRSKSFKDKKVSEHQALQVALSWLWSRHDRCTGSNSTRPSQVQRMLDFCPQCSSPTPGACDKLANIRAEWEAKHPSGNKSGEPEGDHGHVSSDWSDAEGSSEDCSSVDEQTRVAVKSATAQASSNQP